MRPPQSVEEMELEAKTAKKSSVYSKSDTLEANDRKISQLVSDTADGMQRLLIPEARIPLRDTERVQQKTIEYVRVCSANAVLPTVSGLAKALGCTRQAIYDHVKRYPDDESTKWFEDFSDTCAEVMMQCALSGTVAPVPAIFIAKSRYNWRDSLAVEIAPQMQGLSPEMTQEQLQERLLNDIVSENDDG